jgi:DNA-binding transcriptional LysR family regulator
MISGMMRYDNFRYISMQQLEVLKEIVETGSFTRAAAGLFITQPSLTKQIKNLEEYIGTKVINRKHTGVTLTPEGKVLYDYAKRILQMREEAHEKIISLKDNDAGHIFISASSIPATYLLPPVIAQLRNQNPGIRVHLRTVDSEETRLSILNDQAEIGFVGKEIQDRKLTTEALWKDRIVLAVAGGHPWSQKKSIGLDDLAGEPFIVRESGSGTRETIEQHLQKVKSSSAHLNIVCEMGSSEAVKEAIIAGLGVSLLSIHAIRRELKQGVLKQVPIRNCVIERNFFMIYKKQMHLMTYHKSFLKVARNHRFPSLS